ncbi:diterpene geranyllinalool synthase [Cinnamomum micranthum f. kanehirae]|uniref:Diterpene geranyllinalool synthase n=1 Tax=Cinnamomum micranthum f. kanehirae TaxID=337451 RepID=A0A3S3NXP3_9MAGN|nr:diterpene geranyllinalool synthase [Cinnamomum micranthum f. kanehirae]
MEKGIQGLLQKIKEELFSSVDVCTHVSTSAYDTAWMAMIPHAEDPSRPMFPQCLEWMLNNQKELGFWGDELTIDCIPSTLACMIALKTWDMGHYNIEKGLDFIRGHMEKLLLELQDNYPRWFAVVFPGMLERAWSKGLELFPQGSPQVVKSTFIERQRILETKEVPIHGYGPPLIYYYEALPPTYIDCAEVVRHLNADGSLFQSPSATASAFMDTKDKRCQHYLESMVQRCGCSGVPPVHPIDDELVKLCVVDRLERLGLDEHFHEEIGMVLHDVYRNQIECNAEPIEVYISPLQIYKDCMAYRLLTMHGYRVSQSTFLTLLDHENLESHVKKNHGYFLSSLLNIYRASELLFLGKREPQNLQSHSRILLEKGMSDEKINLATNLRKEIEHELSIPWLARVDHLDHRECIERGEASDIWTGKAWFKISCLNNNILLVLAKENYAHRQSIYRSELKELKGWTRDNGISSIGFGREKTVYCYFAMATTAYHPHLRAVRMTSAKNAILFTIIDDFFDVQGSMDELTRFADAVERWEGEGIHGVGKVLFNALNDLINDTAMQAFPIQGRDITGHLRDIWCQVIRSWVQEAEWGRKDYTPSIDEYIKVATVSVAAQTAVIPSLYLVGPSISEEIIHHPDYKKIVELLMISTRLLNDLQSYQKERKEGMNNLVLLFMERHPDSKIEQAYTYITETLDRTKKDLLEHALIDDKNCVPKSCRKIHLIILKIFQMFYNSTNRYDSPTAMIQDINKAFYEPLCM